MVEPVPPAKKSFAISNQKSMGYLKKTVAKPSPVGQKLMEAAANLVCTKAVDRVSSRPTGAKQPEPELGSGSSKVRVDPSQAERPLPARESEVRRGSDTSVNPGPEAKDKGKAQVKEKVAYDPKSGKGKRKLVLSDGEDEAKSGDDERRFDLDELAAGVGYHADRLKSLHWIEEDIRMDHKMMVGGARGAHDCYMREHSAMLHMAEFLGVSIPQVEETVRDLKMRTEMETGPDYDLHITQIPSKIQNLLAHFPKLDWLQS